MISYSGSMLGGPPPFLEIFIFLSKGSYASALHLPSIYLKSAIRDHILLCKATRRLLVWSSMLVGLLSFQGRQSSLKACSGQSSRPGHLGERIASG